MLAAIPSKEEVEESVKSANDNAAPGSDGISNLVYKSCFHIIGDALTEVIQAIFNGAKPTRSQRTSLMIFTAKLGKVSSLNPLTRGEFHYLIQTSKSSLELNKVATRKFYSEPHTTYLWI